MAYVRFNGSPGETWTNDTGKVQYQLIVNWQNSCGLCAQYDHAIGNSWPIPFHFGCRCRQAMIYPNGESLPFVDFREKIADLDEAQRANLVGRANLKLIDAGVVRWEDVVTQGRILDLREVVSAKRLSVERMVDAGVSKGVAEKAWESVHTLAHEQAFDVRREAIGRLRDLGVQRETARRLVAERLSARVSTTPGAGPAAPPVPTPTPAPPPTPVFGRSRATITHQERRATIDRTIRRTIGSTADLVDVASLAGAPDGARVTVATTFNGLAVQWTMPGVVANRLVERRPAGVVVVNESIDIHRSRQGQGIGTEAFGRQAETAQRLGVEKITMNAARDDGPSPLIGYKVWPRFGFDGPIPAQLLERLPVDLRDARNLSDLMRTAEGRAWWDEHGTSVNLAFDPRAESLGQQVWRSYLAKVRRRSQTR